MDIFHIIIFMNIYVCLCMFVHIYIIIYSCMKNFFTGKLKVNFFNV